MGSKEGMRFSVTMMESHGHWSVELRDGAERKQSEMILRRSVMVEYCKMEIQYPAVLTGGRWLGENTGDGD